METATDSSSAEAHEAHKEPMLKLTIRCHPAVPVELDELESWLTAQVSELRAGARRAIIRLSRLTQHFASSDAAIGWLLELEMPEGSSLLSEGRLTRVMADMRLLGIEPTPLAPVDSANGIGVSERPMSSPAQRVLVLTNEHLAEANEVPEAIRPLVDQAEEIYVIAPTLTTWLQWIATDIDGARVAADQRLHTVFDHMHADGLKPVGAVGAENQLVAIADALAEFDADLIVLRLHAPEDGHESWHEHGIAARVRSHFDLPTKAFFFDNEGHVVASQEA